MDVCARASRVPAGGGVCAQVDDGLAAYLHVLVLAITFACVYLLVLGVYFAVYLRTARVCVKHGRAGRVPAGGGVCAQVHDRHAALRALPRRQQHLDRYYIYTVLYIYIYIYIYILRESESV